jgi:5-methylcytosine-specific restriction enzyme A
MPSGPPIHRRADGRPAPQDLRSRGGARQRGYDGRWEAARALHLAASPLCRYCELDGRLEAATLVDHLYPHRGDMRVFWFASWWISSCAVCHSGFKQGVERKGLAALDVLARRLGLLVWAEGLKRLG